MDHDAIADKAAESIMQRVNDTWPRTLHKDVLVEEIGKAIREAVKQQSHRPFTLAVSNIDPVSGVGPSWTMPW